MPEVKTLDQNIAEANYAKRENEREAAGGGRSLSPSDAAGMGASPDQAKMANFKKPGALDEAMQQAKAQKSVAQDQMFEAIEREKNLEEEQLTEEQKSAQKMAEDMDGLGSLDNLVQSAIQKSFEEINYVAEQEFNEETVVAMSTSDDAAETIMEVTGAFTVSIGHISDMPTATDADKAAKAAAVEAAYQTIVDLQTPNEEGVSVFKDSEKSAMDIITTLMGTIDTDENTAKLMVAKAFADGIVDPVDLTIDKLKELDLISIPDDPDAPIAEFGDLSTAELQGIMGDDFATLTVAEIGRIVENKVLTEVHQTATIQKALSDPSVSSVLKEALQGQQAQIEASGMAAIEQDADNVVAEVMSAGSVVFGGEVREITKLLDDANIVSEVEGYLSLDEEERKNSPWYKENAKFAEMIEKSFGQAVDMGEDFQVGLEDFQELNQTNQDNINEDSETINNTAGTPPNKDIKEMFGKTKTGLVATLPAANAFWESAKGNPSVMQTMNAWNGDQRDDFKAWMGNNLSGMEGLLVGGKRPTEEPAKSEYDKLETAQKEMLKVLENPTTAESFHDLGNFDDAAAKFLTNGVPEEDAVAGLMSLLLGSDSSAATNGGWDPKSFGTLSASDILDKMAVELGTDSDIYKQLKAALDPEGDGLDDPATLAENIKNLMGGDGTVAGRIQAANILATLRSTLEKGGELSGSNLIENTDFTKKSLTELLIGGDANGKNAIYKNGKIDQSALMLHMSTTYKDDPVGQASFLSALLDSDLPFMTQNTPRAKAQRDSIRIRMDDVLTKEASDARGGPEHTAAIKQLQEAKKKNGYDEAKNTYTKKKNEFDMYKGQVQSYQSSLNTATSNLAAAEKTLSTAGYGTPAWRNANHAKNVALAEQKKFSGNLRDAKGQVEARTHDMGVWEGRYNTAKANISTQVEGSNPQIAKWEQAMKNAPDSLKVLYRDKLKKLYELRDGLY